MYNPDNLTFFAVLGMMAETDPQKGYENMKKWIAVFLCLVMVLPLMGCGRKTEETDLTNASWEEIVEAARGTTVTFYGWGGDENRNNWLNTTVADHLKQHYDITLEVVGMNIDDILAKLSGEKQAGAKKGSIDMIWINGENFYPAKENGLPQKDTRLERSEDELFYQL